MPMLPPDWNSSAAQASLAPVASSPEYYIPLWWYSGGAVSGANLNFLQKGSSSGTAGPSSPSAKLHTLNPNWSTYTTKFALEVAMSCPAGGSTIRVDLYDITNSAVVAGASVVLTTSSVLQVIRSAQFLLAPGHSYGIRFNGGADSVTMTDASLIVFPA